MSTVRCTTLAEFTACCAAFVREGVTFTADAQALRITLTGGY